MANEIQPSTNVASLVNPSTVSTLKSTNPPQAFGDQTKDSSKQKIQSAGTSNSLVKLEKEKLLLIKEGIQLDINHQKTLFKLDQQHKKYKNLQSGETTNDSNQSTPPQLSQSAITAGKPPYKYKASGYGKNQIEVKIYDSNNEIVIDYILDPPNTTYNDISQSTDSIISQLKTSKDQAEILQDKRYLVHIYGVPEDQIPEPPATGLSDEEYQIALIVENGGTLPNGKIVEGNYPTAKKDLQSKKDKNQKDIDDFKKDHRKKQKDAKKKRKDKRAQRKNRTKDEKRKARKAKVNAILKNGKKTLVPILTLLLSNKIADIIAQNDKIQKLVDDTNAIITDANESGDPTKLANAQLARDNAIKVIQNNEDKITKIRDQIANISVYINIFSVIVSIISAIPFPTSVPPGIGIPVSLIIKFVKILDKANRILLSLSALLPIILTILDKAISILEDLKAQLLNINGELSSTDANTKYNGGFGTVDDMGYKGFKFAIREDNSFGGVSVGPYKRHYAVAIDTNNVDVLKSEYSFTLDTNDLIDQLKLVIDREKLIA
jgi:hypothetical protein